MSYQPNKDIHISRQPLEKRELTEALQSDVEAFLARGGTIKELPPQVCHDKRWSYAGVTRLRDSSGA